MQIDKDVAIYLAGLFDGEGCVTWNNTLRIKLAMTHKETIEWIKEKVGGGISVTQGNENRKDKYDWVISGEEAKDFVNAIFPYSITKKDQLALARFVLETQKQGTRRPKELTDFVVNSLRQLNKRGGFSVPDKEP